LTPPRRSVILANKMPTAVEFDKQIRAIHDADFKEFETELVRQRALSDRAAKFEKGRESRRREFLKRIGVNITNFDRENDKDQRAQEKELKVFIGEFTPKIIGRRSLQAADAKDAALRSDALASTAHLVLPPYASTIFAADRALIKEVGGEAGNGAINSGWVFPDEPGKIRIKDTSHNPVVCFQALGGSAPPEFNVHFAFIPATTANYEMTAVLAFHGFYVLRSDDSWYNCRFAQVKLKARMNVHQYVDFGWKDFPLLIDRKEDNAEEVTTYDRTGFFDYTAVLKAGDPVVVTFKGIVDASARGGGAYAELNFEAGTANYIEPLLLSVNHA